MAESQLQKIRSAITTVIPDLPETVISAVEDTLKALGAETTDDLQYISEGDLLPVLKPIQARRLVVAWAQNIHDTKFQARPACPAAGRSPRDVNVDLFLWSARRFYMLELVPGTPIRQEDPSGQLGGLFLLPCLNSYRKERL